MLTQEGLKIGHWFIDRGNDNYCIIHSLSTNIIVRKYNDETYPMDFFHLKPIAIDEHNISAAGFFLGTDCYKKVLSQAVLFLTKAGPDVYALWNQNEDCVHIYFIHQLQTEYFNLSGEKLSINLFGI